MKAWKLVSLKRDGSVGPLFINRRFRFPFGEWLVAEDHPTRGFAHRPGWHVTARRSAPHLSKKGRVWLRVEVEEFETHKRPKAQGGTWFVAQRLRVVGRK